MKLSASIRAGRSGLPNVVNGMYGIPMTIPNRYGGGRQQGKTAVLKHIIDEIEEAENEYRAKKKFKLKGLRP